jgi:hypothetical protein
MKLFLFFVFAFPGNADITAQPPQAYQLYTFTSYEECVEGRKKAVLDASSKPSPYQVEVTLCQEVEREPIII